MSREQIVNKSDPPKKSEWFGFKYRVNPKTNKLLQEAVFKDGGNQVKNHLFYKPYLFVSDKGISTWDDDEDRFNEHRYPEKEPPQPSKTLNEQFNDLLNRLKTPNVQNGVYLSSPVEVKTHKHGLCEEIPLTSSPIECTLVKARPEGKIGVSSFEYNPNLNFLNQQEESNMSNANRRVVNVKLLDNDSGLPVENALVAQFDNIVTEDSNDVVVQEILLNKNIADAIAKHNQKRVEQTDLEILKRTGNDVKLRPVKLKDLTWVVTTA